MDIELKAKIRLHSKRIMELGLALDATENSKEIYGLTGELGRELEVLQELECQFSDDEQGYVGGKRIGETTEELNQMIEIGYKKIHLS